MALKTITIAGSGGFLGRPIITALTAEFVKDKIAYPIRVITRDKSVHAPDSRVKYYEVKDYSDNKALDNAVAGSDVVLNLLGSSISTDAWDKLLESSIRNKVSVYVPSDFGVGYSPIVKHPYYETKKTHLEKATASGIPYIIRFNVGLFAEKIMLPSPKAFGVDLLDGQATIVGTGNEKICISSMADVGNAIASALTLEPEKIPSELKIRSWAISLNELIELYTATTGKEVKIEYISVLEFNSYYNDESSFPAASRVVNAESPYFLAAVRLVNAGSGFYFEKDNNEIVNPGQKFWKWTDIKKMAVASWK